MSRFLIVSTMIMTGGLSLGFSSPVLAQALIPNEEEGRFALVERRDGVIRLDTRTGAVSFCHNKNSTGWACEAMREAPKQIDDEKALLEQRIQELDDRLAALEATPKELLGKPDKAAPEAEKEQKTRKRFGPSDKDVDEAFEFAEKFFRRFFDMVDDLKKEKQGKEI